MKIIKPMEGWTVTDNKNECWKWKMSNKHNERENGQQCVDLNIFVKKWGGKVSIISPLYTDGNEKKPSHFRHCHPKKKGSYWLTALTCVSLSSSLHWDRQQQSLPHTISGGIGSWRGMRGSLLFRSSAGSMPLSWARFVCLAKQVFNKCVGVSDLGARSVELSKSLLLLLKVPLLVCLGFGGATHAAFGTS